MFGETLDLCGGSSVELTWAGSVIMINGGTIFLILKQVDCQDLSFSVMSQKTRPDLNSKSQSIM